MTDYESGVTAPPFHPWCRCCTAPYFDDMAGERFARDPEPGEGYDVPGDMTYEQWYQKHVVEKYGADNAALMKKMSANETADRAQHEKYKAIYREECPNSLEGFQRMKYTDSERWERLKVEKQGRINALDYSKSLDGLFGNAEVRHWYNAHDKNIASLIDTDQALEQQARQAHDLRNTYKQQARNMMADRVSAAELAETRPLLNFEYYYHKYKKLYRTDEETYRAIIDSSQRPNKSVNERYGLEGVV